LKSFKGKLELRGKSLSQGLLADTIYLFLLSELELMTLVQCRKKVVMALDELTKIKNVTNVQLQLKGFKPMKCLKDYHNLRPPTFIYPDEEAVQGSYAAFIALHRAMLQQNKYETFYILDDPIPRYSSVIQQTIPFQNCNETVSNLSDGAMQICCCILWFTGFITTGCIGPTGLSLSAA
jgi:hypothetical protein